VIVIAIDRCSAVLDPLRTLYPGTWPLSYKYNVSLEQIHDLSYMHTTCHTVLSCQYFPVTQLRDLSYRYMTCGLPLI